MKRITMFLLKIGLTILLLVSSTEPTIYANTEDKMDIESIPTMDTIHNSLDENEMFVIDFENNELMKREISNQNSFHTFTKHTVGVGNKLSMKLNFYYVPSPSYRYEFSGGFSELYVDGEVAYCVEPTILNSATENAYKTEIEAVDVVSVHLNVLTFKLTSKQKMDLSLITNYGYSYPGHQTREYRWATQLLIFEALGWKFDSMGTLEVGKEINEIQRLVDSHSKRPSWNEKVIRVMNQEIIDLSESVLHDYEIKSYSGLEIVKKNGSELKVKVVSDDASLSLKKKRGNTKTSSYVYSNGESQKVLVGGTLDDITASVSFKLKTGKIEVKKISTTTLPIGKAKFHIKNSDHKVVDTIVSDASGIALSKELPLGQYYVEEYEVPSPFVLNTTAVNVVLKDSSREENIHSITMMNEYQRTTLHLSKKDKNTYPGQVIPLEKAVFSLYASQDIVEGDRIIYKKDQFIDKGVSNIKGDIYFKSLPLGNYYLIEDTAPMGYNALKEKIELSIKHNPLCINDCVNTQSIDISNEVIRGSLRLIKTDGHRNTLKGAVFSVYNSNGVIVAQDVATNHEGILEVHDLIYGEYYLKETKAPVGYLLDDEPLSFSIRNHEEIVTITTSNPKIEAKVKITKIDSQTKAPLQGVSFSILDSNNERVKIEFQEGTERAEKDTWITNSSGEFLTEKPLPFGNYTLVENTPSEGYLPIDPIPFAINETSSITTENGIGKVLQLPPIENSKIKGSLLISKKDALSLEPVNARFSLKGETLEYFETIETIDGTVQVDDLEYGTYTLEEIWVEPPYIIDTSQSIQSVVVSEQGKVYEHVFLNKKQTGSVEVLKVDSMTKEPIEGVEFGIYELTGDANDVRSIIQTSEPHSIQHTDSLGKLRFEELAIDKKWGLIELNVPFGYNLRQEAEIVEFEYEETNAPVVIQEKLIENDRSKVRIRVVKSDEKSGMQIKDASIAFELRNSNGNLLIGEKDSEGVHTWSVDALEVYSLKEVCAPKGYILSNEEILIETNHPTQDGIYHVSFYNSQVSPMLPKTGKSTLKFTQNSVILFAYCLIKMVRRRKMK